MLWAWIENDVTGIGVEDFSFVVTSLMGKILSVVKLLLYTTTALRKNKKKHLNIINKWMFVRVFIYLSSNM